MRFCPPARSPLIGTLTVPGDKSVTHRAILFAGLADGTSRVRCWLQAEDTRRSLEAVRALGCGVTEEGDDLVIAPGTFPETGAAGADAPVVNIDCGNSGTTTRLLLGMLAGRRVRARLDGDASLRTRPMARVAEPLRAMGAEIRHLDADGRLPLEIIGRDLQTIDHSMSVASAQVKSALMLAGLSADGRTVVRGGGRSRDHSERMLKSMGVDLDVDADEDAVSVSGGPRLRGYDLRVPGDPSSAAFPLAAALLVPGSEVRVEGVMLNATRTGFLKVLARMGADLDVGVTGEAAGEAVGTLTVRAGPLTACEVGGDEIPTLIDEIPMLAVLAARAEGTTRFRDCGDLRAKESDRIASTAAGLRILGVDVTERPDGFDVVGAPDGFAAATGPVVTHDDHRIAMAFAVAGLATPTGLELDADACVAVSWPGFFDALASLAAG